MNPIDKYLQSRGSVLWGRSYDLLEKDSYQQAKQFIERLWWDLEDIENAMYLERERTADA